MIIPTTWHLFWDFESNRTSLIRFLWMTFRCICIKITIIAITKMQSMKSNLSSPNLCLHLTFYRIVWGSHSVLSTYTLHFFRVKCFCQMFQIYGNVAAAWHNRNNVPLTINIFIHIEQCWTSVLDGTLKSKIVPSRWHFTWISLFVNFRH